MTFDSDPVLEILLKQLLQAGFIGVDIHRRDPKYIVLPFDDRGIVVSRQNLRQALTLAKLIPPDLDQYPDPFFLPRSTLDRPNP